MSVLKINGVEYDVYSCTVVKARETKIKKGEEVTIPCHLITHICLTNGVTEQSLRNIKDATIEVIEGESTTTLYGMRCTGTKEHIKGVVTVKFEED